MSQGYQADPSPSPSPYPDSPPGQTYQNNMPVSQDIRRSFMADEYAVDANRLISKKGSKHIRSLFASIILFGGIATFVTLYFLK